ncbi:MAG: DUF892 family protein [Bacteroidota bacterium]|nr:DUF892 family protein [Bacteroidota bacterium]
MSKTTEGAVKNIAKKAVAANGTTGEVSAGTVTKETMENASDGLQALFLNSLKSMYWAENHLVKTLPKMENAAASTKLQEGIAKHLQQTKNQVKRLEQVFTMLGVKALAKKCDGMEGITKEGEGIVETTDTGTAARDAGVIMASQQVEHFEMAAYSGIIQLATQLGYNDIASLLQESLTEEQQTSQQLTQLAGTLVN